MKLSLHSIVVMTVVVLAFIATIFAFAPRQGVSRVDIAPRLAQLGTALELYCAHHDGRLPPNFGALMKEDLLHPDFIQLLSMRTTYFPTGQLRSALPDRAVVALEIAPEPGAGEAAGRLSALLADGSVVAIPAEMLRTRPRRGDGVPVLESDLDGTLRLIVCDDSREPR